MNRFARAAVVVSTCAVLACSSGGGGSPKVDPHAPVAQAGFDRTVGKQVLVDLDGTASYDPDGFPLAYHWSFTSRPAGSAAIIELPAAARAQFRADAPGVYVVRLRVSDGSGAEGTDDVVITSANLPPVASAGDDREASRGLVLPLSSTGSHDPDQDPLTSTWALVSRPAGSAAVLSALTGATTSVVPDVFGSYVVRLTVSDGELSASDDVTLVVRNHPPVASAGPDLESNDGATLELSAAASSDPDQDPIRCAWTVVSRPAGSAAAPSDPASCTPAVTFDAEGSYVLALTVSDGELSSAPDTVQVTVHRRVWLLGHAVVDAEYARPLERVVAVGDAPNRLYLVDPSTGTETSVDLPLAPRAVSVAPDGLHAAVGHDGQVSYVRLSPAPLVVEKVIATTADVLDVVLAANDYVYAFPRIDQWQQIRCLRISTGVETLSTGMSIYAGTRARLHPGGSAIYGADNGLSPSDIEKYDISSGTAKYLYDSPYHGDYAMCGDLWLSEDGSRIFTACGNTFHSSVTSGTAAGADMTYAGRLEAASRVRWVDHSRAAGLVLAVPAADPWAYPPQPDADGELRLYGDDYLALVETVALPRVGVGGKGYPSHGRFAFFSADGSRRIALVEVDAASGLLRRQGIVSY